MPEVGEKEMIRIFAGDDRLKAKQKIKELLGDDYEIVEGVNLEMSDLPTIINGNSLFTEKRRVLIRDLSENKLVWEKLPKYLETSHEIVILESKLDKRTATYKALNGKVEIREFMLPKENGYKKATGIYQMAKRDGRRAVEMLEEIKPTQEPMLFLGSMVSEAVSEYATHQGANEKRALKKLSKLDMELKSTATNPWLLIEAFLISLASR